jgi:phosphatidylinositol 4-phosphatase
VISARLLVFDSSQIKQSAFARHVLNRQLLALAILNPSDHIHTEMDVAFNDGMRPKYLHSVWLIIYPVWANNGDAISRS